MLSALCVTNIVIIQRSVTHTDVLVVARLDTLLKIADLRTRRKRQPTFSQDVEGKTMLLMMGHSSRVEHKRVENSARQPIRLERSIRYTDSPDNMVEHMKSLSSSWSK
ncbi:hypothetical protein V8G54_004720 [Vigna mungo]|uniref:Uncharacterized protein n=1 Tax=Vigna mungo TaxID=3915 RepID=A0AAQ3SFK7_VIGMU